MHLGKNERLILKHLQKPISLAYRELRELFLDTSSGKVICSQTVNRLLGKGLIEHYYIIDCKGQKLRYDVDNSATGAIIHLWNCKTRPDIHRRYHLTIKGHEVVTELPEDDGGD